MKKEILKFVVIRDTKEGMTSLKGEIEVKVKKMLPFKDTSVGDWHSWEHVGKYLSFYIEMDSFGYYLRAHSPYGWLSADLNFKFKDPNHAKMYCSYMAENFFPQFKGYKFISLEDKPTLFWPVPKRK